MVRAALLAALLFAAFPARPYVLVEPQHPDSHTWVRVHAVANWCAVEGFAVTRTGSRIDVHADVPISSVCITVFVPPILTADLGLLPGGTYELTTSGSALREQHSTFKVRGLDPFRASPAGGSTAGGGRVVLRRDPLWERADQVLFGGTPARIVENSGYLTVEPPPHAAGLVDITVKTAGRTTTTTGAFLYVEPGAAPDPFLYDRILFPIAYEGAGAYDSLWTTDNAVLEPGKTTTRLEKISRPDGLVRYFVRNDDREPAFSSRIRDLTRQADSAGVGLPVVRESDFRERLVFVDVPHEPGFRAQLRVWGEWWTEGAEVVGPNRTSRLTRFSDDGLPFATFDVTEALQRLPAGQPAVIGVPSLDGVPMSRMWGLLTITNNTTQQVTVYTPQ
jgi:hypothetical protein